MLLPGAEKNRGWCQLHDVSRLISRASENLFMVYVDRTPDQIL
jgi:hypothetical protein